MAKPARFIPRKTDWGWRLSIPAKFSQTGKRQNLHYPTKDQALEVAARLKADRDAFGAQATAISPSLAEQATTATRLLEPFGIGLLEAVQRLVEIETRRRESVPIADAIAAFRAAGDPTWSASQSTAYRLRGDKLVAAFGDRMLATIEGEELRLHLEDTTTGPSAYNMAIRLVRAIWNWSAKPPRQWCETTAVQHLDAKATTSGEVGILTPTEARAVLDAAVKFYPECVVPFAIALFTGMRQKEIERMKPSNITPEGITVPALSAKTKRRRFIQMPEPLAEWLKVYPVGDRVCPSGWEAKQNAVRRMAGFAVWSNIIQKIDPKLKPAAPKDLPEWPANALRHTAATMAVALGKPLEQLVFEHGHAGGLEMLRRHYVGAMTKADAIAIWSIRPGSTAQNSKPHLRSA